jgi:site-specific recombinase XerD
MSDALQGLLRGWELSMKARNLSPATIGKYLESGRQLADWLAKTGVTEVDQIERRHVEGYIAHVVDTRSAATAHVRYRSIQQWFGWLVEEEEIDASPMAKMRPPTVPEAPVPLLSADQLRALLKACEGKGYPERRDTAIIRLFVDACACRSSQAWPWTTSTSQTTSRSSSARAAGHVRARSGRRPGKPSTGTCAAERRSHRAARVGCGWPQPPRGPWASTASGR